MSWKRTAYVAGVIIYLLAFGRAFLYRNQWRENPALVAVMFPAWKQAIAEGCAYPRYPRTGGVEMRIRPGFSAISNGGCEVGGYPPPDGSRENPFCSMDDVAAHMREHGAPRNYWVDFRRCGLLMGGR